MHHPILYAEQMWLKQRFWAVILVVAGLLASGVLFYQLHRIDQNTAIWLLYIPSGLVLLAVLQLYRMRHRLDLLEEGFRVRTFLSSVTIGYDRIRQVRVQPLKLHFQEGTRKRHGNVPMVRPLLEQNAVFIRVRLEPDEVAYVHRKLGARLHDDGTIALPVPDPDAAAWELSSRMPARLAANQGGGRRKRRR